ncbi:universal stress protein [Zoogloeaceae bacteirum Par-f-2]|jgi:nucleotide-binding universal stress UspA family protein|uniref:universal stress protein n=1 Tax=Pseudothauera hydrothermalis TaxID=2184083 RepID=UPI000C7DE54D|nr:universal stress protein [Pseudothauera hydrothermalis]AUL99888.1 universal stress protein A [Rhodocyclaceae bacterium]AVZ79088.1 universal stress protein [Zoogloeaceae bacteirum Par-f-2]
MHSKTDFGNKVLACVDRSHFADYVTDYAAWAAKRLEAPLELLHVINRHPEIGSGGDHSGAIGFNAQEQLLSQLSEIDAQRARQAREAGRIFLNRLRQRAIDVGVPTPDMRQRHGELGETLAEHEAGVRLFVLGRRGESAQTTQRDLGRNVEHVVRALRKPILTVTEGFCTPRRALIAYDGSSVTRRGVEMIAASPLFRGLPVHLLMSGKPRQDAARLVEWAQKTLQDAGFEVCAQIIPGDPESIIARAVRDLEIDILVMGAYAHSPLRSLLFGSKTTDLLRSSKIPTLLLR